MARRSQPYRLSWPLSPEQLENIDEMFQLLFDDTHNGTLDVQASQIRSGILSVPRGGTSFGSYAVGDILYADTSTTLAKLADVATGNALISGGVGVAPSWGKIGLTTHVSGILPVANGGTGLASYTVGDLLYASAATVLSKLAAVATGSVLVSQGTTTAPAWSASPSLTTSLTVPLVIGGTAVGSTLTLRATSGNGTLGAAGATIKITAGNNGATEIARFVSVSANDPALLLIGRTTDTSLGSGGNKVSVSNATAGRSGGFELGTETTTNGTDVGFMDFGSFGCPAAEKRAAAIHSFLEASAAATMTGSLRFYTTNAGTIAEKFRITPAGLMTFGGGATSSFPALKRSSAILICRLADDSADAEFQSLRISTNNAATFHTSRATLTDGAGVAVGTLNTAPAAGDPTKWIGIDDNGTTRYVPAW